MQIALNLLLDHFRHDYIVHGGRDKLVPKFDGLNGQPNGRARLELPARGEIPGSTGNP